MEKYEIVQEVVVSLILQLLKRNNDNWIGFSKLWMGVDFWKVKNKVELAMKVQGMRAYLGRLGRPMEKDPFC